MTSPDSALPAYPPTIETVVDIRNCNPGGDLFGGWMLAQMDLAGAARAFAYAGNRVVTAGVTDVSFVKPVFSGDLLRFYTRIERIGRTSVHVMVDVWAQHEAQGPFEKTTKALYSFVSVDGQFRPIPLPVQAA